jgi:hypothetical protein
MVVMMMMVAGVLCMVVMVMVVMLMVVMVVMLMCVVMMVMMMSRHVHLVRRILSDMRWKLGVGVSTVMRVMVSHVVDVCGRGCGGIAPVLRVLRG